jgi:response regulator RpfG family c-di-GMP phosphodiesterase
MHDEMLFASEGPEPQPEAGAPSPWKIAVVDDDESVRAITRLALAQVRVDGRPLELLEATSAAEGIALFAAHDDIALGLVDMVMEEPTAGLRVVDAVRKEQGNHKVRLVVRTGQPGHLPEEHIVREHEVNDYREKTELSAQKLRSVATHAIRAYRDLDRLEADRHALAALLAELAERCIRGHGGHARAVAALAHALAGLAGWPQARITALQHAALLHDLGMAGLRRHAADAANLLTMLDTAEGRLAARLAREHHERWDGQGHPQGLAGEAISAESRLLAIANAIEVRIVPPDGRTPDDPAALREHLEAEAGRAYDPGLAMLAARHLPQLLEVHRIAAAAASGP